MRVAHFLPFPGIGGTEHATLRLAEAVRPRGVESLAFCAASATEVAGFFREHGVETHPWHSREPGRGRVRASYAARTAQLAWLLRRRGVRVVHCADSYAVRPQVLAAARLAGAGVVCHVRNRNDRLAAARLRQLARVDHFLFVSRASWRRFALPVAPERGTVLYDGVVVADAAPASRDAARDAARAEVRRELGLAPDTPLVTMAARVEPQKDFATLARAARRVAAELPAVRFLVAGGTDATPQQRAHFPEVQRMVAECGVGEQVRFLGFRRDVRRLLRASDVSLLTTHWEGLPLVLWEAMAEGVPVVATAVDGVSEAVEDGVTGHLLAEGDAEQAADRLLRLLRDPALARRMGDAGRAHARAAFDPGRFGEAVVRAYEAARGRR